MHRYFRILIFVAIAISGRDVIAQGCCSGGSGSPIAEGASPGVLKSRQLELASNFQMFRSDNFFTGDKDTVKLFDHLNSNYIYSRLAYGLSKRLTMSFETGYFINKTLTQLNNAGTIESSGFGDIILFPRYELYNRTSDSSVTTVTFGLGYKIPVGSHSDSTIVYTDAQGNNYYTTSPPTVQPTNGSQDIIFNAFFFKSYPKKNFRFYANSMYILKGWNSLGQKFGDYCSLGLYIGTTVMKTIGITLQIKGDITQKMQYDKYIDMLALYNIDVKSTGGKKISLLPQLTYSFKNLTVFIMGEIPAYQYLNGTQIGAKYQVTGGLSYRYCL